VGADGLRQLREGLEPAVDCPPEPLAEVVGGPGGRTVRGLRRLWDLGIAYRLILRGNASGRPQAVELGGGRSLPPERCGLGPAAESGDTMLGNADEPFCSLAPGSVIFQDWDLREIR